MQIFRPLLLALLIVLSAVDALAGGRGGSGGAVAVRGYVRKDGTYVPPHYRSAPDGNFSNNWSTVGNVNPYTGEEGKLTQPPARAIETTPTLPSIYRYDPPKGITTDPALELAPRPLDLSFPADTIDFSLVPTPHVSSPKTPSISSTPHSYIPGSDRLLTFAEKQKVRDAERAQFWQARGYNFNPTYLSAYAMDQKVKDIDRAAYWKEKNHNFNPEYMSAYAMDQKVKDIERSQFWETKGYKFNPDYMSSYAMDQKVRDIERAAFWKERGLNFDPNYMTAYAMDREASRLSGKSR